MIVALIIVLAATTIALTVYGLRTSRSNVLRHVAALDTAAALNEEKNGFLKRFITSADESKIRAKLNEAGWYKLSVTAFYARSFVTLGLVLGLVVLYIIFTHNLSTLTMVLVCVVAAIGLLLPGAFLDREIAARKKAIHRSLPDWLDTISTTVEAGTALNAALAMSLEAIRGPMADELREVLADVRIGRSRADALTAMAARVREPDLTSVVLAMVQTEKLGGNIGGVLDELAQEARHKRLTRAEEIAAAMPVKMVVPMALFILPALFVIVFGPVIADVMSRPR